MNGERQYRARRVVASRITDEWFDDVHPNPLHPYNVLIDPVLRQVHKVEGLSSCFPGDFGQVGDYVVVFAAGQTVIYGKKIFDDAYEEIDE